MKSAILRKSLPLACAAVVLGGCGNMSMKSVWPFGDDKSPERSRVPANATEYRCGGNKHFYVRLQDEGASAWVILPEREFRLDRQGSGASYGNGRTMLDLGGDAATLTDGGSLNFSGCAKPAENAGK